MKFAAELRPNARLAGLALRMGLALVLSSWAYDILFNPTYYIHVLHGFQQPVMVVLFALTGLLVIGLEVRITGVVIAAMLVVFGLVLEGHQPIGLPQNYGLAAGALALAILGPGYLALRPARRLALTKKHFLLAATVMRGGLALTFLIYAVAKLSNADEYRIIVSETAGISLVASAIGAQTTVNLVAGLEVLMAFLMLPGISSLWGALFQALALSSFLLFLGYPFSFPQDLGLLGIIGGLVSVQTIRLPLVIRRAPAGVRLGLVGMWSGRFGLDGRRVEVPAASAGAVIRIRLDRRQVARLRIAAAAAFLTALDTAAREAIRPTDTCASDGADGYYLLAPGVDTPQALDAILKRLRSSVKRLSAEHARCPSVGIGASLWNWTVPLPDAMRMATGRARMDTITSRAGAGPAPKPLHADEPLRPPQAA